MWDRFKTSKIRFDTTMTNNSLKNKNSKTQSHPCKSKHCWERRRELNWETNWELLRMEIGKWSASLKVYRTKEIKNLARWGTSYSKRFLMTRVIRIKTTRRIVSCSMRWSDLARRTRNMPNESRICKRLSRPRFRSWSQDLAEQTNQRLCSIRKAKRPQIYSQKCLKRSSHEYWLSINKSCSWKTTKGKTLKT